MQPCVCVASAGLIGVPLHTGDATIIGGNMLRPGGVSYPGVFCPNTSGGDTDGWAGDSMDNEAGERVCATGFNAWGEVDLTSRVVGVLVENDVLAGAGGGGGAAGTNLARLARLGFSSSLLELASRS